MFCPRWTEHDRHRHEKNLTLAQRLCLLKRRDAGPAPVRDRPEEQVYTNVDTA